ncbi:hypothetical protein [Halosimplex sp. J119]
MRDRTLRLCCVVGTLVLAAGCLGTHASNRPSADHALSIENYGNESATFDVTVVRNATGEVVHNRSYTVEPGERREVYNTNESDPDGVETFDFRWEARNESGTIDIETNSCYGTVLLSIDRDGSASGTYTIC